MTPTERSAYAWLLRQGYQPESIQFRSNKSPDFLTADGLGWEVKRLVYGSTSFSLTQLAALQEQDRTCVLFFADGMEPVTIAPFSRLPFPGDWQGVRTLVYEEVPHAGPRALHSPEQVASRLAARRTAPPSRHFYGIKRSRCTCGWAPEAIRPEPPAPVEAAA